MLSYDAFLFIIYFVSNSLIDFLGETKGEEGGI